MYRRKPSSSCSSIFHWELFCGWKKRPLARKETLFHSYPERVSLRNTVEADPRRHITRTNTGILGLFRRPRSATKLVPEVGSIIVYNRTFLNRPNDSPLRLRDLGKIFCEVVGLLRWHESKIKRQHEHQHLVGHFRRYSSDKWIARHWRPRGVGRREVWADWTLVCCSRA